MKLYYYSSELHTYVEAKWVRTKVITGGILVGIIMLFGFAALNQSSWSRSADTLHGRNEILQLRVSVAAQQLNELEMLARQLRERADNASTIRVTHGDDGKLPLHVHNTMSLSDEQKGAEDIVGTLKSE